MPKPVDLSNLLKLLDEAMNQPLVLVVDDDPDLCRTCGTCSRQRAYRVGLAHDAGAASTYLHDNGFKVILIDMRLPDADGAAVFHAVRQAKPHARTVLITGHRAELCRPSSYSRRRGPTPCATSRLTWTNYLPRWRG